MKVGKGVGEALATVLGVRPSPPSVDVVLALVSIEASVGASQGGGKVPIT